MAVPAPTLADYKAQLAALKATRDAISASAGVPFCSKCGELAVDGANTMTQWSGPRCNKCASLP